MVDDYDSRVDSFLDKQGAGSPQQADPYESRVDSFLERRTQEQGRLRASVLTAAETTPEAAARQRYLSTMTGLPPAVVKTAEGQAEALAKLRELQLQSASSPVLRARLMDPNFAEIAQNDGKALSAVERTVRGLTAGVVGDFAGMTLQGVGANLDMLQRRTDPSGMFRLLNGRGFFFAEDIRAAGDALQKYAKENIAPPVESQSYYDAVTRGLGQVGGQIALQLATGGTLSFATLFAQGSASMLQKVEGDAASQNDKDLAVLTGAGVTAITEKYALDKLLGPMAVPIKNAIGAALARIGIAAASEGAQEAAENIGQDVIRQILTNPDAKIDLLESAYEGGVGATVGAIVRGTVEAGLHIKARGQQREIERAKADAKGLQDLLKEAGGAQVRELDQPTFAAFTQAAAERAKAEGRDVPTSVFVDGRTLADALQQSGLTDEQLDAALPSIRQQMVDAIATGTAVEIPIGELAAALPGTPLEKALLPEIRVREDGLSLNEAKAKQEQAQRFLEQEADRVLAQAANTVQAAASFETVRQKIKADLDTAGRFSADVNEKGARLAAQFYTVMAKRLGTTPEQLYDAITYRVRGQGQAQGDALNADAFHGSPHRFDRFDLSKIGTGEGTQAYGWGQYFGGTRGVGESYRGAAGQLYKVDIPDDAAAQMLDWDKPLSQQPENVRGAINQILDSGVLDPESVAAIRQRDAVGAAIYKLIAMDIKSEGAAMDAYPGAKDASLLLAQYGVPGLRYLDGRSRDAGAGTQNTVVWDQALLDRISASMQPGDQLNQSPGALPLWALERAKGARVTEAVKRAAIALSPKAALAERNYKKLDAIFAKVPNPLESAEAWRKFMSLLVADRDVLGVPYEALKYAQDPQAVADYLKAMRPDQLASRRAGFALGAKIRAQYASGKATPVTTGRLLLWGILSRKAGAYPHEAAYMDLVNAGVDQWIEKAARGDWTDADTDAYARQLGPSQWTGWAPEFMASKKSGVSPGAGVSSNAFDFGGVLLAKLSQKDENGVTGLARLHNLMADPEVSTDQVRRAFFAIGDGLGIQNKVLSFVMLVTGRWDTLVLDRVQFTHLWGDAYRSLAEAAGVKPNSQGLVNIYDPPSGGLVPAGEGHFGVAVYEALSRGMTESVRRGYELAGLTGEGDGTLGAFHWDSWLVESSQAIGHPTLEALTTERPRPDLAVRQGKFDTYSYNFEYRADGQYQIPLLDGSGYRILSPADAAAFSAKIADDKEGVVPKKFKVSKHKDSPWIDAEGVNRGRYDEILAEFGRPAAAGDVAPAGAADAGGSVQQPAAAEDVAPAGSAVLNQGGRSAGGQLARLPGAPSVPGFDGPDPRLVAVAEQYARDNGIDLRRQSHYAQVDPERAARIADAYAAMPHAPQDPAVREAYANMIRQTRAQYDAMVAAGYRFWFIDLRRADNQTYASTPWNAMRDIRANQAMGVFQTTDGFGSDQAFDPSTNPLLEDTGLRWPVGDLNGPLAMVTANDLFRAVHDAFGHGLEGAGFRAQGEENAWQAHVRLFTGSAIGAVTSETRGQNSWLNFGPHGEKNRTAKVEDTVFADQKTGLMPEWTWTEGRVEDEQPGSLEQGDDRLVTPGTSTDFKTGERVIVSAFHGSDRAITSFDSKKLGAFTNAASARMGFFFAGREETSRAYMRANLDDIRITTDNYLQFSREELADIVASWDVQAEDTSDLFIYVNDILVDEFAENDGLNVEPIAKDNFNAIREWVLKAPEPAVLAVVRYINSTAKLPLTSNPNVDPDAQADNDGQITEVLVRFRNPLVHDYNGQKFRDEPYASVIARARDAGHDGVILLNTYDGGPKDNIFVAFSASQIRYQTALYQPARGTYDIASMTTVLNGTADLSTFLHETGHFFLDAIRRMVVSGQATPEVVAMYQASLKGLGVTEADWNAWHDEYDRTRKIPDGMRKAHEKWAETFEAYLFSGKAPNVEMQSLFRTFASWLKRVYKSLQEFVSRTGTALDPDLKAVMDRMLATDEQIADAELAAGLVPDIDATAEAQEKLNARSLRDLKWTVNARNAAIAKLQKQAAGLRKTIEEEVRAEVERQPVYRAEQLLRYGKLPETEQTNAQRKAMDTMAGMTIKLGLPQLKEMYGDGPAAPWRYLATGKNGLAASEGVHPDVLADAMGFSSGDALVRALLAAEPIGSVVEGMTDQRMLERHGDLATPEAIAQAASEAVHNEARAKSLATELAAQREMLNAREDTGRTNSKGQRITVNALAEAAKTFAATVIGRRKVGDLKKATYQHQLAERRAGEAWREATARGDTQAAVQAKQDQMLNNAAVRAGQAAQEQLRKTMDLFRRITRGTDEKLVERGYDPDIANAARAILAAYGIAPSKGKAAAEYLETLQKNDPQTFAAVGPSVTAALVNAKPFDELTVEEVGALKDEVESLWHLAKRSRQMEVDGDLLDREEVQEALQSDLEARGIPDSMPGDTSAITPAELAIRKLLTFRAAATRAENWTQGMGGMFTKYVWQPVKEAANRYRSDSSRYLKRYRDLLKTIAPSLRRQTIAAPELNYTFGKDTGGIAMQEILHAILHTGNASNKRKLLLGRKWATENADGTLDTTQWDAFLSRLAREGVLTREHMDFAQGVWDMLEELKPAAQKTHRDVFGRYFAEVTADSFIDPFGVMRRGGYVPAIADSRIVSDAATRILAEEENASLVFAFPATNRGFTKGRVEYNRPLLLDLRTLSQHINKVLLFSHLEQPVRDVRRVLTAKEVAYGLNRIDPVAFNNILTPWLNRAARQIVETPTPGDAGLMRIFSVARNRAGMAAMFANVANAAQQLTGFSIAAVKVKPRHLLAATAQMMANPRQMKDAVADASIYMRERMENETSNAEAAIREILLNPSLAERSQAWAAKHAYFLQQAVDNSMGPIIWTAAFNEATEGGASQKDAVRFADSVIRTTQGSTLPEDISKIESGDPFIRLFTQFYSYFNMQANLLGTEFAKIARDLGVRKGAGKMLYVTLFGFLAPAWVAEAIMQAFRGGPDDEDKDGEYLDDWLAAVLGWSTLRSATAMVPGVGQVINAVVNAANSKPYDDRLATSPAISMVESAARSPVSVYKAIVEDGSRQKAVRDVSTALTLLTGVPVAAAARPLGYLAGTTDYRIEPTGPVDLGRGLITGVPSPESRAP